MTSAPPVAHVIYLHGFASSPASSKARWFADRLAAVGVTSACPDLNEPDFESLTVTRMLGQVRAAVDQAPRGPVALMGSSLGGFVALHAAAADTSGKVDRLVLLAPAIDFGGNRLAQLGPHGIDEWRERGTITVTHHAYGEPRAVGFGLYADAARYDAWSVDVGWPVLAFQGTHDDVVDPVTVEAWAARQPRVRLHLVDDGHQLSNSLDQIWAATRPFLGL